MKKRTLAQLLLQPSVKKAAHAEGEEVLEPILTSPYVRDHFGRKACDLLPPEHADLRCWYFFIQSIWKKIRKKIFRILMQSCLFLKRRAKRDALLFAFGFFSLKRDIPLH